LELGVVFFEDEAESVQLLFYASSAEGFGYQFVIFAACHFDLFSLRKAKYHPRYIPRKEPRYIPKKKASDH